MEEGHIMFTYQVSSEPGADGLIFFIDGLQVMDLESGATHFVTLRFNLSQGMHILRWVYLKDESQSGGLDEAILSVCP